MIWKQPHISKIYEALTAIADKRIELVGDDKARCYSSSRGKYYEVEFDLKTNSFMSNDNTAYYTESFSYPMVAVLLMTDQIDYDKQLLGILAGIFWKDINQKYKNDYDRAIGHVLSDLKTKGVDTDYVEKEIGEIYNKINFN